PVDHDDLATITRRSSTPSGGSATWCLTWTRPPALACALSDVASLDRLFSDIDVIDHLGAHRHRTRPQHRGGVRTDAAARMMVIKTDGSVVGRRGRDAGRHPRPTRAGNRGAAATAFGAPRGQSRSAIASRNPK